MLAFGVVSTATTKANSTSAFSSPRERVKTCLRVGAGGAPETRAKACRVGNWPEWQEGKGPFAFGRRVVVSSSPPASKDGDAALTFFAPDGPLPSPYCGRGVHLRFSLWPNLLSSLTTLWNSSAGGSVPIGLYIIFETPCTVVE